MRKRLKVTLLSPITLALTVLMVASGCAGDDEYIKSKAAVEKAKADAIQADTRIKMEDWGLTKDSRQSQIDAEKVAQAYKAEMERIYGPIEKEQALRQQQDGFWTAIVIALAVTAVGLGIGIDRYRLIRRKLTAEIQAEQDKRANAIAEYARLEKEELERISGAQRKLQKVEADVVAAENNLLRLNQEIAALEKVKTGKPHGPRLWRRSGDGFNRIDIGDKNLKPDLGDGDPPTLPTGS